MKLWKKKKRTDLDSLLAEFPFLRDTKKYAMVKFLMEKDENVIATALMYAEGLVQYGVDVTEKMNTAVENMAALQRAENYGYMKALAQMDERTYIRKKEV